MNTLESRTGSSMHAVVYASCSPGSSRHEAFTFALDLADNDFTTVRRAPVDRAINYFVMTVGEAEIAFAPDTSESALADAAQCVLRADIRAVFRPQAWIRDYAVEIDGRVEFDAMASLIELQHHEAKQMFSEGCDFDCLASDLPEFEAHQGPFEVDIDEHSVVHMVRLFAGRSAVDDGLPEDFSCIRGRDWDDFCDVAKAVLAERVLASATLSAIQGQSDAAASSDRPRGG